LELLASKDPNVRRLAAGQVITLGLKAAEMETMEARLAKLEELLGGGSILGRGLNTRSKEKSRV